MLSINCNLLPHLGDSIMLLVDRTIVARRRTPVIRIAA
jgi:hypothetical protein